MLLKNDSQLFVVIYNKVHRIMTVYNNYINESLCNNENKNYIVSKATNYYFILYYLNIYIVL